MLTQFGTLNAAVRPLLDDPASAILEIDRRIAVTQRGPSAEATKNSMVPLAGSLIPWSDSDRGDGTSPEEWKGGAETNKILGRACGTSNCAMRISPGHRAVLGGTSAAFKPVYLVAAVGAWSTDTATASRNVAST